MSKKNYEPIRDYISMEDFLDKAGYRRYKPKVGILGKALIEACRSAKSTGNSSKHQGRSAFLNRMLDVYFKKLRQQKKDRKGKYNSVVQKQNSRHHLQSNAPDNRGTSISGSIESDGCTTNG